MHTLSQIEQNMSGAGAAAVIYNNDNGNSLDIQEVQSTLSTVSSNVDTQITNINNHVTSNESATADSIATINTTIGTVNDKIDSVNTTMDNSYKVANTRIDTASGDSLTCQSEIAKIKDRLERENSIVGMVRVNGSASSLATGTFGTKETISKIGKHIRLGIVKDGKCTQVCKAGKVSVDNTGNAVAIDGTSGDLMLVTDVPLYLLKSTGKSSSTATTEENVMGVGLTSTSYNDAPKELAPFAMCPDNACYDTTTDTLASVYNTTDSRYSGSFSAPGTNIFTNNYMTSGMGYNKCEISCVQSMYYAEKKNTTSVPTGTRYMGLYYEYYELMIALMSAELQRLDYNNLTLFGSGAGVKDYTNAKTFFDEGMSANSGWKVIKDSKTAYVRNGAYDTNVGVGGSTSGTTSLPYGLNHHYYVQVSMFEGQRLLSDLTSDTEGGYSYISSIGNVGYCYYYNNGTLVQAATGSGGIDLSTGDGMVAGTHYYVVRNVPGCEGMADGVMTAVINRYTKLTVATGVCLANGKGSSWTSDTMVNGEDIGGATAIFKCSIPIYRGLTLPLTGCFRQTCGAHYVIHTDSGGTNSVTFMCAPNPESIPTLGGTSDSLYQGTETTKLKMEEGLSNVRNIPLPTFGEGWMKTADYSMSLWCYTSSGGGSSTYESAYLWLYPSNNAGAGNKQIHGSVVGCASDDWCSAASVRTALCSSHAGLSGGGCAGAFAVLNITYA